MCTVSRKTQIQIPRSYWTIDLSWGGRVRQIPGVPGLSHSTQLGSRSIDRPYYKKKEERRKKEVENTWSWPLFCLCTHSFMMEVLGNGTLFYEAQDYAVCKKDVGEGINNLSIIAWWVGIWLLPILISSYCLPYSWLVSYFEAGSHSVAHAGLK